MATGPKLGPTYTLVFLSTFREHAEWLSASVRAGSRGKEPEDTRRRSAVQGWIREAHRAGVGGQSKPSCHSARGGSDAECVRVLLPDGEDEGYAGAAEANQGRVWAGERPASLTESLRDVQPWPRS